MEQNPGAAGPSRKPPSPSPYLTAATQHYHHPPPSNYSQIPPENQTAAAPQGFLPFYHPNQFFRGFLHANAAAGFGQAPLPPPRTEAAVSAAAAGGRSGLQQNQGETGSLFVKPFTENKEATALESRKAVLMGEFEAMCGNAPPPAAAAPPPSAAAGDSDIDDDDVAEITECMEEAVKKLMAHQQSLHESFIEKLEKMEARRRAMEEEWRQMEMERMELMASFTEKDKAIAVKREEIIFGYLEKVTGQTIQKPEPASSRSSQRWPDHEVNKLVEIRGSLEPRFNQPGCKIGAWEEISRLMAAAGYQRTAMRCKEKWENINSYFKKLKKNSSSPRKRAKTCQYYEKLDQLYSKSSSGCSTSDANGNAGMGHDQTTAMKKEEEEGRRRM